METQEQMEIKRREMPENDRASAEETTEDEFLKNLYLFMKKRNTPIERIPHLGFKQIDLFVMFKTVEDMGGYHKVTSQQMWKQVYNTLGGNPRSTSAATCTRRHYEKLLLPYECHIKGLILTTLPQHQPEHLRYASLCKEDHQRPAKRKLLSFPVLQNPYTFRADPCGTDFPRRLLHPNYYHLKPSHPNPAERIKEPLEQLRYLAEQYKCSSGLMEPLNLSVKESNHRTSSNPTSSFSSPSSSKIPKFLNTPSPLYTPPQYQLGARKEGNEVQIGEADAGVSPHPLKDPDAYVIDLRAKSHPRNPEYERKPTLKVDESACAITRAPPKTDWPAGQQEGSPERRESILSQILPGFPQEVGSKMEIEVPLSVFHNWLRLYSPSTLMHAPKQLTPPNPEKHSEQKNCSGNPPLPIHLAFHNHSQRHSWGPATDEPGARQRTGPLPASSIQISSSHHKASKEVFTRFKHFPSKSAASQDVYLLNQTDNDKTCSSKAPDCWSAFGKVSQMPRAQVKSHSFPSKAERDPPAAKSPTEETHPRGRQEAETRPSAVLMVNSSPASVLQLTTEEMLKLKKMISNLS